MLFDRTGEARQRAERFGRDLDELCRRLAPWPREAAAVGEARDAFARKTRAFFDRDHVFSLAVIGQVKAGKSTFLNALLFGGQEVLPGAPGPKTAVLTRLEYAPETRLTVEYYTLEDWEDLRRAAAVPLESPAARGARVLLQTAEGREQERDACAAVHSETFPCPDRETLTALLEQTAGGQGPRAPFVKSVTLGLCRPELEGLCVADTPGLNDPVPSRSQRTRAFLEECDAAFFLIHSGYFLDRTDVSLLAGQLPQKGIRLCLVGSRFDGALADEPDQSPDQVRRALTERAARKLDPVLADRIPAAVRACVRDCRQPLFVSAVADRMAAKSPSRYTAAEKAVARCLGEPDQRQLADIGGMEPVRRRFEQFVREKDETLADRARDFAAAAQAELRELLARLCEARLHQEQALAEQERLALDRAARLAADARRVQQETDRLFEEYLEPLDTLLEKAQAALAQMGGAVPAPAERRDVTLRSQAVTVSDATVWKPWTWGRRHREYRVQESAAPYWESEDTLDFLAAFPAEAALLWDGMFAPLLDTSRLHNQLALYARRALEESGRPADAAAVETLVRSALAHIYAPRPSFGTEAACARLRTRFPDRVRDEAARRELEQACAGAAAETLEAARQELDSGARRFARTVNAARDQFCAKLLEPVEARRRQAQAEAEDIRRRRASCREFVQTARQI